MSGFDLHLAAASTNGRHTDVLFLGLLAMSAAVLVLVLTLVIGFSIRYRRGSKAGRGPLPEVLSREFEIGWTAATLFLFLFVFWWAASSQLTELKPPKNALEVHVVAKQWMWKLQHNTGVREINALHVPVGVPIRLVMTSQDVIHSFYVPAFRIKQDVLPGRYTETWFNANRTGTFHLFCAEYCGTDHSAMTGEVVVMTPSNYARWTAAQPQPDDLASQGATLFAHLGCASCHGPQAPGRNAPDLHGVFGSRVLLSDGRVVLADENYLRDSIVLPEKDIVAGYPPIMPSFAKSVDEEGLVALVAYVKSLSTDATVQHEAALPEAPLDLRTEKTRRFAGGSS